MIRRWLANIKQALIRRRIAREKKVRFDYGVMVYGTHFEGFNKVGEHARLIHSCIGIGSYVSDNCWINRAQIGKYCSIAPFVKMGFGTHPSDSFVSTHPAFYYNTSQQLPFTFHKKQDPIFEAHHFITGHYLVQVGNDVWIGAGAIILDGVKIGDGAIVAAGAVVIKDVEPYSIVAGVPAKMIRKRFSEEHINFLLANQWWDKPIDQIRENYIEFSNVDNYINFQKR